jgi:3-hydroxybutyryl-CoA dehydrogenase
VHVTVLGAGTMGAGIAGLCARSGHETWLRDVDPEALDAARDRIAATYDDAVERDLLADAERHEALARVEATTELGAAAADAALVVEAVPERLDLKREVVAEAADAAPAAATLATNTSSLSVTTVAAALDRPERFVGLHFFNPPHAMQLVEVVRGERTADSTASFAVDFVESLREELGERFRPPQVLRRKVRAGKLGKKSGEGFCIWEGGEPLGTDR